VVILAIVDAYSECGERGIDESRSRSSGEALAYCEAVTIVWAGARHY
jgi:hypothetical protein